MSSTTLSAPAPKTPLQEFWYYFCQNRGAVIGLAFITLVFFAAVFAGWVAPFDPIEQNRSALLLPPAWMDGGNSAYLLGTDDIGRDILSRIIYGARLSVFIGLVIVVLSCVFGVILGLLAGYYGGVIDIAIMRFVDIMLAIPSLLLTIGVVTILGPSLINAAIAIAIVSIPSYVRLTRASVMSEKNRDYVVASRVAGAGVLRLMFIVILPNCLAPLIVQMTMGISNAILELAALGFLGIGAQPPTPELGTMLAESRGFMQSANWLVTIPGLAILSLVLAFNLMGDGLRDALDPKLKQ
ncbi:ABC transporter permease subunit [Actinobacillus pleuropneumoniae]|uniref:Dipeptide transport system permease n=1 Tax=Actinobacillus pleuropneumoniae TaxID=715 RepID=A0A3S4Y960_ACTPL|nr:ABC transporter permease subunit [Actinobacillus pleuropneumoniae]EFL79504.1 dipeptide transport system permease protein [Actinobacillus pleuropneumoniae serovar 2 str. 4226]EFM88563.1 Dipeptide transport system permease protein dppC [Actinobacillus pleuropneumoniae serovar 2 str. S1536]MEE3619607.1 ABC transporter permease subunit [Actinobacillus pleuropneumoniae]UKH08391.1 ABC transporter permease subunit [Actinobacillus pleuropneumoniae]UKH44830.1 dipeptide ABC transporter permease DppC 